MTGIHDGGPHQSYLRHKLRISLLPKIVHSQISRGSSPFAWSPLTRCLMLSEPHEGIPYRSPYIEEANTQSLLVFLQTSYTTLRTNHVATMPDAHMSRRSSAMTEHALARCISETHWFPVPSSPGPRAPSVELLVRCADTSAGDPHLHWKHTNPLRGRTGSAVEENEALIVFILVAGQTEALHCLVISTLRGSVVGFHTVFLLSPPHPPRTRLQLREWVLVIPKYLFVSF